jgi:plastocyanin
MSGHTLMHAAEVKAQLVVDSGGSGRKPGKAISAVIWLQPVQPDAVPAVAPGKFTLLQKNKMFSPHLLVVPVGSSVAFPNADPFFHNVFSLFDGKRFDLGLYEAGSTRSVMFSREGVSYIFCNIHSEMSAVVIALGTPFYSIADTQGSFRIEGVPNGDYSLYVWVEGERQNSLDQLTRRVHITGPVVALGEIHAGTPKRQHLNKFGRPYEPDSVPTY